jgi:hypothetical protein
MSNNDYLSALLLLKGAFNLDLGIGYTSDAEITRLQDPTYCNETFKINYEVLRKNSKPKRDANGRNRYYKEEVIKGYWLCSKWVENQWDSFLAWENKHK